MVKNSAAKYLKTGTVLLISCIFLLTLFVNYFNEAVNFTQGYGEDKCMIVDSFQTSIPFRCQFGAYVSIVVLPCLTLYVNTTTHSNVKFYRTFREKNLISSNSLNVQKIIKLIMHIIKIN
jgi:hypothetical protein